MTEHVAEFAERYWRRELDEDTVRRVERHMAACDECRTEIERLRDVVRALSDWGNAVAPVAGLSERITPRLASAAGPRWWRVAAVIALCLGCGAAGYGAGARASRPASATATATAGDTALPAFLLLLEEPAWPPAQPLARSGYGDWTVALRSSNRFVGARKLTEDPGVRIARNGDVVAAGPDGGAQNLSGWYLIRARNYDEAVELARQGPHLRYGSILVRQVE